uniref:FOXP coiled-coil domain-containing protein n=1 Tax=Panagrolaimus superbus TaxID=310955 RepID=A0A914YKL0_9BILA
MATVSKVKSPPQPFGSQKIRRTASVADLTPNKGRGLLSGSSSAFHKPIINFDNFHSSQGQPSSRQQPTVTNAVSALTPTTLIYSQSSSSTGGHHNNSNHHYHIPTTQSSSNNLVENLAAAAAAAAAAAGSGVQQQQQHQSLTSSNQLGSASTTPGLSATLENVAALASLAGHNSQQNLQIEQLLMLAIQERVAQQLVASPIDRLWQNMLSLGGAATPNTGMPSPLDLSAAIPGAQSSNTSALSSLSNLSALLTPNANTSSLNHPQSTHSLYQHGMCIWPQCNTPCNSYGSFIHHLSQAHSPERSTHQYRAQIELVDDLEHRIVKEKQLLNAMKAHMHMKLSPELSRHSVGPPTSNDVSPLVSPKPTIATTPIGYPSSSSAPTSSIPQNIIKNDNISGHSGPTNLITSTISGVNLNAVSRFYHLLKK